MLARAFWMRAPLALRAARAARALAPPPPPPPAAARRRRARRAPPALRAARDPYEVLGVPRSATLREVKAAYRRRALKLHPDVNRAPDARERFVEAKDAYTAIAERAAGGNSGASASGRGGADGPGSGGGGGGGGFGGGGGSGGGARRAAPAEEFYGFSDLFRDVEKEWAEYEARAARRRAAGGAPAALRTLWEELAELGEEFVEFLEGAAPASEAGGEAGGGGGGGRGADAYDRYRRQYGSLDGGGGAAGGGAPPPPPPKPRQPPPPPKSRAQAVEDDLAELKRKLGKL
jgi:uncharacterized membrane protein YgcG